jgi:membrane peptidoglycan carboxypeptidase
VLPEHIANEVKGVLQSVVDAGTGTAARQPFPVYGKTGTTDDFTNAWFTGCSDTLCIAVWMGYDKEYLDHGRLPHSMKNVEGVPEVFGGTLPAKLFAHTFSNYRLLRTTHHLPAAPATRPSASPTSAHTTAAPKSTSRATPHATHRPTRTPPPPTQQPSEPPPSPSPSRTLFPPPTAAPPT